MSHETVKTRQGAEENGSLFATKPTGAVLIASHGAHHLRDLRGWAMKSLWLKVLVGWIVKGLVVRYGGLTVHRGLRPFFLSLVLSDLLAEGVFGFVGMFACQG